MISQDLDTVDFYTNLWVKDWYDMERLHPTSRHLQRFIISLIAPLDVKNILDAGCGVGVNIKLILNHLPGPKMLGVDLSPEILTLARRFVGSDPRVSFSVLDLGKDSLDQEFDLVLCSQVLEHIEDDITALKNLVNMCSKYLLITVPSGRFNSTSKLVGHYRHYSFTRLLSMLEDHNLNVLSIREWGFPFHTLYKKTLGMLPDKYKKRIGMGKYSIPKRMLCTFLYGLFHFNFFNKGDNIIVLAKRIKNC